MEKKRYLLAGFVSLLVVGALLSVRRKSQGRQFAQPATSFRFSLKTGQRSQCIVIPVTTSTMQKIRVRLWDYDADKTVYTDRFMQFVGTKYFEVMLPVSPEKAMITIQAETHCEIPFEVGQIRIEALRQRLDLIEISPKVQSFIKFATDFAVNASYLPAGKTYKSDNDKYFLQYLPVITGEGGKKLNTSARINEATGTIQASKKAFDQYTVPGRMAVLFHEWSHFYQNQDPDDESEADLNGLLMYLSLGYPRVEAFEVWASVFQGADNAQNKERFKLIGQFIDDFENDRLTLK